MNNQGSAKTGIAIAAIVALVLGGSVGYGLGMNNDNHSEGKNNASSVQIAEPAAPVADLRVGMNNLLREHVSSSLDVTRLIADEASEAEINGAKSAQTANAGEIAAAVGSVYGEEAQAKITELFVDHIEESNNYAVAVASGDEAAKMAAQNELNEYLNEIAAFFSGAIKDLPEEDVYALLQEHENLLNQSVVAYNNGEFDRSFELERQALTQVSGVADALSAGIAKTVPEKFNQ